MSALNIFIKNMNNNKYTFFGIPAFFFIFCFAAALRFYNLGAPSIWVDEAFSIWIAKFDVPTLVKYISIDAHPPLYFIFLHFWIKLFGDSEFATRSLSVLFNLGSLVVIYYFCCEMFAEKKYALLASLLYAVSSFVIITSATDVKMYSTLEFFTILSIYLLYKIVGARCAVPLWQWALYVIVLILNLYTQYYAAFAIIAQLAYLFYVKRKNVVTGRDLSLHYIIFILFLSFLPWNNSFFEQALIFGKGEHLDRANLMNIVSVLNVFSDLMTYKLLYYGNWALFLLVYILLLIGIEKILKQKNGGLAAVSFFGILFIPFAVSYLTSKHIFQARYFCLLLPIFIIILSCGIINAGKKYISYLLIALFLSINLVSYYDYATDSKYWKQDWRSVANYVSENTKPGDIILLQIGYNTFPFNYYYKNNILQVRNKTTGYITDQDITYPVEYFDAGGVPQQGIDFFDKKLLEHLKNSNTRIFFILNAEMFSDKKRTVLKWLDKNCVFIKGIDVKNVYGGQSHITVGIFDTRDKEQKTGDR